MKKLFYAIAALAVVASCAKVAEVETNVEPKDGKNLVHMTIRAQAPETKTFIEKTGEKTYQPQWNSTDKLGVFFDSVKATKDAELENTSADGAKAEFYGPVSVADGSYRIYAYSPSDATISKSSDTKVVFTVPTIQYPSANTFDSDADIVVSKAKDITIDGSDVTVDDMVFGRILSSVKVTISNANASVDDDEKINAVVISATDGSDLTGTISWDFEDNEAAIVDGVSSVTAMLTASPIAFDASFFLLVNPTTVTASAVNPLTITIYTNAHKITKTITSLAKDLVFPLGGISELNISTAGAAVTNAYIAHLVKSPSTLIAGDEVVIASADYNEIMSTEQKTNNRGQVEASLFDEEFIFIDDDAIQRFAVEAGTKASTFAFKGINGDSGVEDYYIYAAASDKNYLKSEAAKDDNASFTVSFNASGVATMIAQGTNTRNILRYNSNNGLFSCYSTGQDDVAIYRYKDGVPALATPTNLLADYDAGSVEVVWDAVAGADSYTVTFTGKATQEGLTSTSTTFTEVTPGTYTITVTAISNDHSVKSDSAPASITLPLGNPALGKPVIKSFIEIATGFSAEINSAVEYATSYDWDLYEGSVDVSNWIGTGNTTSLSFDVAFAATDIAAFTPSETYYLVVTAKADGYTSTESDAANFVAVGVVKKEYTLTINASDFNTTSYAANNNEKTKNAVAADESTFSVKWTSYQVMKNSTNMQWQKNAGYIYNSTDLGEIKSVTVNSSAGSFTKYYGTTEQPTSTTLGDDNGFFKIKVGSATGTTSSVVIVFEK